MFPLRIVSRMHIIEREINRTIITWKMTDTRGERRDGTRLPFIENNKTSGA